MTTRKSSASLRAAAFALVLTAPLFAFADTAPAGGTADTNADTNAAPAPAPAQTPAPETPAATAPAATPAPAAPAPSDTTTASTERPTTYTITSGDSLWKIAHQFGITVVELRKANHLKKGALLHPGQALQIPAAKGDTTSK